MTPDWSVHEVLLSLKDICRNEQNNIVKIYCLTLLGYCHISSVNISVVFLLYCTNMQRLSLCFSNAFNDLHAVITGKNKPDIVLRVVDFLSEYILAARNNSLIWCPLLLTYPNLAFLSLIHDIRCRYNQNRLLEWREYVVSYSYSARDLL